MAQNGGGGLRRATTATAPSALLPLPRLAAPQPPLTTTASQTSAPPNALRTLDGDFITLAQPRPGIARARNEYIETPLRPPGPLSGLSGLGDDKASSNTLPSAVAGKHGDSRGGTASTSLPNVHGGAGRHHHHPHPCCSPPQRHHHNHHYHFQHRPLNQVQPPVVAQPTATLKKGAGPGAVTKEQLHASSSSDSSSIICRECRRCKCDACRNPKRLPSTWICENKYQCSAETTVDYCSCMCCVKGLLYHCMKDYDMDNDVRCADKPCSCHPHRRCTRWGCMVALVPLLPCLLCYWPLKGCVKLCELGYTKYHSRGCQCRDAPPTTPAVKKEKDPIHNKRLLDPNAVEC